MLVRICCRHVCLLVCVCVCHTLVLCVKTAKYRITQRTSHDREYSFMMSTILALMQVASVVLE